MDTVLVDIAADKAVTISRIRDATSSTWHALRQTEQVLLPHVARQSQNYSLKKAGEPWHPHCPPLPVRRSVPYLVPAGSRRPLPGLLSQISCLCCIAEGDVPEEQCV